MHNEFDFMIPKKESIRFSGTRSFFLRRGLEVLLSYILVTVILVSTIALTGANKTIFASNRSGNAMFGNPMSGNPMSGNPISENPMSGNPMSGNPTSNYCGNNAQWSFVGDTLTITGTGKMYNYSLDNLPPWYQYRDRICSVIIQSGITSIGSYAFYECDKFTDIVIPVSVKTIEDYAFYRCRKLENVELPDMMTSLGNYTFYMCDSLKSIVIPKGLVYLGDYLFYHCSKLPYLEIPDGVKSIGRSSFETCANLMEIKIPDSVNSIGVDAFCWCRNLTSIHIPDGVSSLNHGVFAACSGLESIKIPDSVTSIDVMAFNGCRKLTEIKIPDGVTTLGKYAFSDCTGITSMKIPDGITRINYAMFEGCSSLVNVEIPESVTVIDYYAFYGCNSLTSISLPQNVTSIGYAAFYGCNSLKEIEIPERVSTIVSNAFEGCSKLTSIIIPKSVKSIASDAFLSCSSITDVYLSGKDYSDYKFDIGVVNDFNGITGTTIHIPCSVDPASLTVDTGGSLYHWYQLNHNSVVNDLPAEGVTPLAITNQPVSCKQLDGKKVNFSVGAEGDNLTYQWQFRRPGASTWANAGYYNAKTDKLTFVQTETRSKNMYRCVVTDAYGRVAESDEVEAILVTGPSIVKQPVSVKARLGTAVSFAVEAEGEGLSYQWQFQKPGKTTWANSGLASAKKETLKFKMAEKDIDKKFRCIVTDVDGFSVISEVVSASLLIGPVILTQPTDVDAAAGAAVRISTAAEGDELKYRWQYQKEGQTTWINSGLASATLPTLTFKMSASYDGRKFRCKVTDADGNVEYTDIVAATLVDGPAITKQPEDVEATLGDVVYFNITATGDGLTYQWQYQASGKTNWINSSLAGNKTAKLRVKATDSRNGGKYRCVVTDEEEIVAVSYSAVLIVN